MATWCVDPPAAWRGQLESTAIDTTSAEFARCRLLFEEGQLVRPLDVEGDSPEELQEWEQEEEDDEKTEITNYDVGEEALDRISIALGGKTMVRRQLVENAVGPA